MEIKTVDQIEKSEDWRALILLFPGQKLGLIGRLTHDIVSSWRGELFVAVAHDDYTYGSQVSQTLKIAAEDAEQAGIEVKCYVELTGNLETQKQELDLLIDRGSVDLVMVQNSTSATELTRGISCDVGIVRGSVDMLNADMGETEINKVLLPSAGGPNTISALGLLRPYTRQREITTLFVVDENQGEHGKVEAKKLLADILHAADVEDSVESVVTTAENPTDGIAAEAVKGYDLVMIGATEDALSRIIYGDIVKSVVRDCQKPVVIMKRATKRRINREKINWQIRRFMPNLSRQSRNDTYKRIRRNSRPEISFYVLIALSAAIAGSGLLLDSPAVVIGAMLVAPLMSPIVGVGLAMVLGDTNFLRTALTAIIRGVLLAVFVGMMIGLAQLGVDQLPAEVLSRTSPSLLDLAVALFSGLAGAYALCYSQAAGALPGVSISAALVPPLVSAGISFTVGVGRIFGFGDLGQVEQAWQHLIPAGGAMLLFGTNFVTIAAASGLVFFLLGFRPTTALKVREAVRVRAAQIAAVLLLINALILGYATYTLTAESALATDIEQAVAESIRSVTQNEARLESLEQAVISTVEGEQVLDITAVAISSEDIGYFRLTQIRDQIGTTLLSKGYDNFDQVGLKLQVLEFRTLDPAIPPTATPTPLPGPTQTFTPTPTATKTVRPTATSTATSTPTATPTQTLPPTETPLPSQTPTPAATATVVLAVVTADNLELRADPSTSAELVTTLSANTPLLLIDGLTQVDGAWWQKVQTGENEGWVLLEFLTLRE